MKRPFVAARLGKHALGPRRRHRGERGISHTATLAQTLVIHAGQTTLTTDRRRASGGAPR